MSTGMVMTRAAKWTIAPEGMSAFRCMSCDTFFTLEQEERIVKVGHDYCLVCEEIEYLGSCWVSVKPESARHLDEAATRSDVWYHATRDPQWMETLLVAPLTPMVHVGTLKSAQDRMYHLQAQKSEDCRPWYLYSVAIAAHAEINPSVRSDDNDDAPRLVEDVAGVNGMLYNVSVNRYVNSYEAPGSISLLVNPADIEIIDRQAL